MVAYRVGGQVLRGRSGFQESPGGAFAARRKNLGTAALFSGPSITTVMRRRSLPQVVIPVPCHVDWNAMAHIDCDGRARFCDSCERPVYDSASMTRGDLVDLIARHEGRRLPCVRLHRRPDGTIVTKDCFAPLFRFGRFLWLRVGLAAAAFWAGALGLRSLTESIRQHIEEVELGWELGEEVAVAGNLELEPAVWPRDPASLAPLPRSASPPRKATSVGISPLLSSLDRAAPLRHLEADEDIWKRLEPERHELPRPGR